MLVHGCRYLPDYYTLMKLLETRRPPASVGLTSGTYVLGPGGYKRIPPRAVGATRPAVPPQSVDPPALREAP